MTPSSSLSLTQADVVVPNKATLLLLLPPAPLQLIPNKPSSLDRTMAKNCYLVFWLNSIYLRKNGQMMLR